ncbi:MAG: exo-beta-N-acetylmuramidase NamZ domain-containing protein [Aristaeellaceae bacterium]
MIRTGIDNLHTVHSVLAGRRLGLMTNPTGVSGSLRSTIDILHAQYHLTALFACEHGVRGDVQAGAPIQTMPDPETGVTVYSVYGASHHLSEEMLAAFDVFVFDMQDVGARFYTYLYSLSFAMEDCARAGKPVVVLDRPNPLGGLTVAGTLLDERVSSFVGEYAIPTRYGLTIGEYALWVRDHLQLDMELHIVRMDGWRRDMTYEDTGLAFVPPSPNCATLHAARVYIGTCVFEGTNVSEGRGTVLPFEYIGAPFIDAVELERRMNALGIPGVVYRRAYFTPQFSKHAGQQCRGVQIHVTDARHADTFAAGLYLLETIREMHGDALQWTGIEDAQYKTIDKILGTDAYRLSQLSARELIQAHRPRISAWQEHSRKYWLYP